jgi:hypothetical protein
VVDCLKSKDSLQQAFTSTSVHCYPTSTIYSLHRKLNPGGGLMTAKQFFTVLEIEAAVALLDMAVVPKLMRWLTRISAIKSG